MKRFGKSATGHTFSREVSLAFGFAWQYFQRSFLDFHFVNINFASVGEIVDRIQCYGIPRITLAALRTAHRHSVVER